LLAIVVVRMVATVSAMAAMHEHMHQRVGQNQQEWQCSEE